MGDYRDLIVYQKAFQFAMDVHRETISFPDHERFGLVSQLRRSSKSVCAIMAEAYLRRHQEKYFMLKLGEIYGEHAETQVWLDFARACKYLEEGRFQQLTERNQEIGRMLRYMLQHPHKFA
jgi:four helix bundle protein